MPTNSDEYSDPWNEDTGYIDLNEALDLIDLKSDYDSLFDNEESENDYD